MAIQETDNPAIDDGSIQEEPRHRIVESRRLIVVEPILIMSALFGYPLILLSQLFIVQRISDDLAAKVSFNISPPVNHSDVSPCTANKSDPAYVFQEEVQQRSAAFTAISALVAGFPALFVTLFLRAYSDKAGRKYAILPPLVGTVLKSFSYLLVIYFNASIWWLLIGSFLDGCCGFYITLLMGCFSYIADTTQPKQRMFRITVLEMSMFLSAILGPIGVGYIIEKMGFFWPFLVIIGGYSLNILYVIFLVPETVQRDPNARFFSKDHIKKTFTLFTKDNHTKRRWKLIILFIAFFISSTATLENGTSTLFVLNSPLCWNAKMIGYYTATSICVIALGGILVAKIFKFCLRDPSIALIAGVSAVIRNIYTGFVQNTIMMFFVPVMALFSVLFIPTIRAIMSGLVKENEQGAVFGAIAFAEVVCTMFGSVAFNAIYASTVYLWTGFVFFAMAMFYFVGALFLVYYVVRIGREERDVKRYQILTPEGDLYDDCISGSSDQPSTFVT